jgi:hypothetical protein
VRRAQTIGSLGGVVGLLLACAAWSAGWPPKESSLDELPKSWDADEIAEQTPPYAAEGRVYVLAWKVEGDDRPFRVESCLVLKVLQEDDGYGRWCLAHLYRHPAEDRPQWRLATTHFSGAKGTKYWPDLEVFHAKRFKDRPGNKEVYASLSREEVGWRFEAEAGMKLLRGGTCEKNWQAALGEKPTRFVGK